ncbi:MAG: DUF2062 domain-containing protein, partial [Deltaproteobacteria bacterium]|nr:DUF2062 domain-containing protein [Deltaproteobacteria bacterium]
MNAIKQKIHLFIQSCKELRGKPRYVAMGMSVGIFVSLMPLVPFQTIIALPLAHVLRGSKRAAALGVWFSNPLTLPVCYYASYKTGKMLLDIKCPFDGQFGTFTELIKMGLDVTSAMLLGGIILGLIAALIAY